MNSEQVQANIIKNIVSGNYGENLRLAIKYSALAVKEEIPEQQDYLLAQSQANSLISLNLIFEDLLGLISDEVESE